MLNTLSIIHIFIAILFTLGGSFFIKSKLTYADTAPLINSDEQKDNYKCTAAREFITAYNYLVIHNEFKVSSNLKRQIALDVASGCSGSAKRFIRAVDILTKAKLDTTNAIKIGKKLAIRDDATTEAFILVFQKAFISSYLDLDLLSSIKLATELSIDYQGDNEIAYQDFSNLVSYCVNKANLGMPKPYCATFAKRVALYGKGKNEGIFEPFRDLYQFLTIDQKGPLLTKRDGLKVAEEITAISPFAPQNFIMTYNFAMKRSELNMGKAASLDFARDLAKFTVKKETKMEVKNQTF